MLEDFTSATFAPLVGQTFQALPARGAPVDLVLSACEESRYGAGGGEATGAGRVPFSLLFHAGEGPALGQQTFTVRHPDLGEFPLFLVPLGPDGKGMRYEAVFG